jgi:hypothetical protein
MPLRYVRRVIYLLQKNRHAFKKKAGGEQRSFAGRYPSKGSAAISAGSRDLSV